MTAAVSSSVLGMLLAALCVGASAAHWAIRAWGLPRRWQSITIFVAVGSGELLLVLMLARFALLASQGG